MCTDWLYTCCGHSLEYLVELISAWFFLMRCRHNIPIMILNFNYVTSNHEHTENILKGVTHCYLPDCDQPTWPFENYCGKTHADLGKKMGLPRKLANVV